MVDIQIAGIDIHVQKTLQWTLFIVEMSSLNNSIHIVTKHDTNPLICIYNMCLTIYRKKLKKYSNENHQSFPLYWEFTLTGDQGSYFASNVTIQFSFTHNVTYNCNIQIRNNLYNMIKWEVVIHVHYFGSHEK